jgi:ketosteroid isomerase-like protein
MSKDDLTANKAMAYKFIAAIVDGDVDALLRLHHPDATWWMLGTGTFDLETYIGLVRTTLAQTTKRTVAITGITAEGDRVAFEAEG